MCPRVRNVGSFSACKIASAILGASVSTVLVLVFTACDCGIWFDVCCCAGCCCFGCTI